MSTAKTVLMVLVASTVCIPDLLFAKESESRKHADEIFNRWLRGHESVRARLPPSATYWASFSHELELRRSAIREQELARHNEKVRGEPVRDEPAPEPDPIPVEATVTPEPATLLLIGTGLAGIAARRKKRNSTG